MAKEILVRKGNTPTDMARLKHSELGLAENTGELYFKGGTTARKVLDERDKVELDSKIGEKLHYSKTIALMKTMNLKDGDFVRTAGFYAERDGGGALYSIQNVSTTANDSTTFLLTNTLKATLVIEGGVIDIRQLGGKSVQDNNNVKFDNKNILLSFIDYLGVGVTNKITTQLLIPQGIWCFSETCLFRRNGIDIKGYTGYVATKALKTTIAPMTDNQAYVWKLGGLADFSNPIAKGVAEGSADKYHMTDINLRDLTFTTLDANGNSTGAYSYNGLYSVTRSALFLDWCAFGVLDNITFKFVKGTGLAFKSCWELYFPRMNFRAMGDFSKPKLLFETHYTDDDSNYTALEFGNLMFESINGTYIESRSSRFANSHFGNINCECSYYSRFGEEGTINTAITNASDATNWKHYSIIKGNFVNVVFDSINIQHMADKTFTVTATNEIHYLGTVFDGKVTGTPLSGITVNNILIDNYLARDPIIVDVNYATRNTMVINNIVAKTETVSLKPIFRWNGSSFAVNNLHTHSTTGKPTTHNPSFNTLFAVDMNFANGRLIHDLTSLSKEQVVLQRKTGQSYPQILGNIKNMVPFAQKYHVRIKHPVGLTYKLVFTYTVNGGTSAHKSITGTATGNWELIEVDIPVMDIGGLITLKDESVEEGMSVDCVIFGKPTV